MSIAPAMHNRSPAVSAERVLGVIRSVLAFAGVDDVAKLETVALLASTDLDSGDCTIAVDDRAALASAIGRPGVRP